MCVHAYHLHHLAGKPLHIACSTPRPFAPFPSLQFILCPLVLCDHHLHHSSPFWDLLLTPHACCRPACGDFLSVAPIWQPSTLAMLAAKGHPEHLSNMTTRPPSYEVHSTFSWPLLLGWLGGLLGWFMLGLLVLAWFGLLVWMPWSLKVLQPCALILPPLFM